ncbi:MAG: 50S ribosomal protein L9 [Proteobacteria bacterium]|nr:50S ribosomal protein L9 [Pseudomonadota bacterium]
MQVILTQDIEHLGKAGELVTVKPGYGRNYLVPQGLAISATERNVRRLQHERTVIAARVAKEQSETASLASRLNGMTLQFERVVGDDDKMFGSVTARNISEQLRVAGIDIEHRRIMLHEPIRALGKYEVDVKLKAGVLAKLKFWIVSKQRT